MSEQDSERSFPCAADALPSDEIAALKELERRNRDLGAAEVLQGMQSLQHYYLRRWGKSAFQLQAELRTYLRYLAPRMDECVLDAGAGMGRFALLVAPQVKRLVCLDLSATALQVLESEARRRGIRNIETVQGDLCTIPSSLGPFDRVYAVEVLGHIPSRRERGAAVQRLHALLKPGGRCLISVYGWNRRTRRGVVKEGFWGTGESRLYHYYFTCHELKILLQEAGFRDVRLRGLNLLPGRITRHLPTSFSRVETWCSMVPVLAGVGRLIFAIGRR